MSEQMNGAEMVTTKSSPLLGIFGAILGALVGGALWVGVYQLGIIAAIAGIAIMYLSFTAYCKLSKTYNMVGLILSFAISMVALIFAHCLSWGLEVYFAYSEYGITLMDALMALPEIAFSDELIVDFVKEFLMGTVCIVCEAFGLSRKIKRLNAITQEQ